MSQCPRCWRLGDSDALCRTCQRVEREESSLEHAPWEDRTFHNYWMATPFYEPSPGAMEMAMSRIALDQFKQQVLGFTNNRYGE